MGFFSKAWKIVKDVGAGILSLTLGTLAHYIYIGAIVSVNLFKPRIRISDCLIKVMEDLDLFSNNVNLSKVRIVKDAIGLAGVGLTNNYTIYLSENFNEVNHMHLYLHELKHVEQYQDLGYIKFVAIYDFQVVRYGKDSAPLEEQASSFADNKIDLSFQTYLADCTPVTEPSSPNFKMILNEEWTMLLDLM